MKMKIIKINRLIPGCFVFSVFFICLLLVPKTSPAQTKISGQYLKKNGKEIILQLNIGNPPPSSIIVLQHVQAGASVVSSSPKYDKYNRGRGEIKWLIKSPSSGKQLIHLHLQEPMSTPVSASVRFKDPVSGAIKVVNIN